MTGTFITSTSRGVMHPLAFQGILATDCFAQLTELVRTRLGTGHMLLFAEPVSEPGQETIDWYSPVQGEVRLLSTLSPEKQQACLLELSTKGEEIKAVADTLKKSGDSQRAMGGHLLELALQYPDASMLYVVGEQPVLVGWGFGPSTAGAQPQHISRVKASDVPSAPASPAPSGEMPPPAEAVAATPSAALPPVSRSAVCWWWLLPLLLLALLLGLLCVSWGGFAPLCPVPGVNVQGPALPFMKSDPVNTPALEEAKAKETALLADLAALSPRLLERAALCQPSPAPTASVPPVVPVAPLKPNELVIPPQGNPQDLSFMEGVWRCDTGLVNTSTGARVAVEYSFGADGKGRISIDGDKGLCTGAVTASIQNGNKLVIVTDASIPCPKGAAYSGQQVECMGQGADALCKGQNLSAGSSTWDANFYRK